MSRFIVILLAAARAGRERPPRARRAAPVILVFGDSLSAGYGLRAGKGWVSCSAERLRRRRVRIPRGERQRQRRDHGGGLARLPRALDAHRPGDRHPGAGRQRRPARAAARRHRASNLVRMIAAGRGRRGSRVLLVGMRMPPNYGARYTTELRRHVSRRSPRAHALPLVPFLLDGVAWTATLMQADGLHPNAQRAAACCSTMSGQRSHRCCGHAPADKGRLTTGGSWGWTGSGSSTTRRASPADIDPDEFARSRR